MKNIEMCNIKAQQILYLFYLFGSFVPVSKLNSNNTTWIDLGV